MREWPFDFSASWYLHELDTVRKYMLLFFFIVSTIVMIKSFVIIRKANDIINYHD